MSDHTIKTVYTAQRLNRAYIDICNEIRQDYPEGFDCIVALSRGGLIPATYFSHLLDVNKVIVCGLKSYNGRVAESINVYQHVTQGDLVDCNNILIVDDISDKGYTLEYIVDYISERAPAANIKTATICIKEHTTFIPNWYDKKYDRTWWVEFDWEMK